VSRTKLSIGDAWSEARGVLARDGGLIATVALALLVLPGVLIGTAAPPNSTLAQGGLAGPLVLLSTLIGFVGQIAIARIALGPPLTVGQAIGLGFRRFGFFFVAWVLWLLPFVIGIVLVVQASGIDPATLGNSAATQPDIPPALSLAMLLLIIGMLVVAARMLLLYAIAAGEPLGPIAMLKRSWQLSRGRALKLFGLLLLIGLGFLVLVLGLGSAIASVILLLFGQPEAWSISALLIALLEGVLSAVVSVFAAVLLARIYAQLSREPASVSVPEAGRH
jgi:hypothetical protein